MELMEKVSESLAGRVAIVEMSALSQREIDRDPFNEPFLPTIEYVRRRQKSVHAPQNLWERIYCGGYPALQDPSVRWESFFANYVRTYLERDVREFSTVRNPREFLRFMTAVATRTGQVINFASIADEVDKDQKTIRAWMSILEASGIIYLLEPYASSALKRAIKTPKVYFRDTGLAAYLTRWLTPETLADGAMSGAFFETFVISEILKSYANRGLDYRYFVSYYRGRDKKKVRENGEVTQVESEIDLIIEQDGVLYPIEIKRSARVTPQETSAFLVLDAIEGKKRGMGAVVCNCPQPGMLRENILQIPVWYI